MTKLILINGPEGFHERLFPIAAEAGVEVARLTDRAADLNSAAQQVAAKGPDVVMVGLDHGADEALGLIEALDQVQPLLTCILIADPDAAMWQQALRSGARDLLPPEADDGELAEAIERAAARSTQRPVVDLAGPDQPTDGPHGRIITVMSPKGGSGKTMLATNLAYTLQHEGRGEVVIVDYDLQFGDVAGALSLRPEYSVTNALRASGDVTATKSFLTPHPSGLFALCAPANPAEADEIEPKELADLLHLLQGEFDWVIVDTSAGISEANLVAVEASTDLLVVATTDLAAIQAMRKVVVVLDQIGLNAHDRYYVLNRANAKVGVGQADIERSTGLTIDVTVPSARAVPISMNQGLPVLEDDPRSPASRSILDLLQHISPAYVATEGSNKGWLQRIRS